MSFSQFTIYTSGDASGPGPLSGTVGSVLTILDACLVNGYSGKTAAGWTKPFANASNIGCYKQGVGSGYTLVINDAALGALAGAKEFLAAGWKTLTGISSNVGAGTGQFPTTVQLNTVGAVVGRKSNTASSVIRSWVVFADARTFYFLMASGDVLTSGVSNYMEFMFGDFFALNGSGDVGRCMIVGRANENNSVGGVSGTSGGIDYMTIPASGNANTGAFLAGGINGLLTSLTAYTFGNISFAATAATTAVAMNGIIPQSNPHDASFVLSPVYIMDSNFMLRGYFRGLYHICHSINGLTDGQVFNGVGDFFGKAFVVVRCGSSGGMYALETSPTVSTN